MAAVLQVQVSKFGKKKAKYATALDHGEQVLL